jgi:hypothetical protein
MSCTLHFVDSSRNAKNKIAYNRAGGARFPFSSPGVELVSRAVDGRDLASARERPRWACCSSRAQYGQRRRRTRRVVTTLSVTTAASATTMPPSPGDAVTVAEAARLLGRDRTRVLHVAAPEETLDASCRLSDLARWAPRSGGGQHGAGAALPPAGPSVAPRDSPPTCTPRPLRRHVLPRRCGNIRPSRTTSLECTLYPTACWLATCYGGSTPTSRHRSFASPRRRRA